MKNTLKEICEKIDKHWEFLIEKGKVWIPKDFVLELLDDLVKELREKFDPEKHAAWFTEDILKEYLGE